jgi:nitrite reductase/ring-hydroxylating ferredoxin subunit
MGTAGKTPMRTLVAVLGEVQHGQSKKFSLRRGGRDVPALLINFEGQHFAYINRCPHTGITLDWVDNKFFSSDERYLMCATHGAVFQPPTGECIWGPCLGLSLQSVPIEIYDGKVYARLAGAGE